MDRAIRSPGRCLGQWKGEGQISKMHEWHLSWVLRQYVNNQIKPYKHCKVGIVNTANYTYESMWNRGTTGVIRHWESMLTKTGKWSCEVRGNHMQMRLDPVRISSLFSSIIFFFSRAHLLPSRLRLFFITISGLIILYPGMLKTNQPKYTLWSACHLAVLNSPLSYAHLFSRFQPPQFIKTLALIHVISLKLM